MTTRPAIVIALGATLIAALGAVGAGSADDRLADELDRKAAQAIADSGVSGVTAKFRTSGGWATRHPLLSGGEGLDEGARAKVARAVYSVDGVAGVQWSDGTILAESEGLQLTPLHCQKDVEALLRARTIRFEEGSSKVEMASNELLDEVAAALRPCLGSIIAVTGHTDSSGPEPGNIALSQERADAVEQALIARGIPSDGLRARGVGSREPVEGLEPTDPANRRIEFSVIATEPLLPTPIDTPGPR
ncbi:OmpA family protein [Altererythrobacter sp. MF3-039]|uniref:OmpA family protein n=1 Tax=Altererythrobacter sp. MF3-039 TaxID=3252901 RepID=UPI00390CBDE2